MAYDLIILGAGPAGITAAVYAARKRMKLMVLTENVGGQTIFTAGIENYTGYINPGICPIIKSNILKIRISAAEVGRILEI